MVQAADEIDLRLQQNGNHPHGALLYAFDGTRIDGSGMELERTAEMRETRLANFMTTWQRWRRQPQTVFLRRALFQIHLWTGVAVGLYIFVICLSGSVLVYRNELYTYFSPKSDGPLPLGFRFTAWLLDFHDNLLAGETGRRVNGMGAASVIVLCLTGAVIWWPGIRRWRQSLRIQRQADWKRFAWTLHSAMGFWCYAFILMWGITGVYLSFQAELGALFDYIQPLDETNPVERMVDHVQYWLAYLHFGRLGGRGIPGCGRGLCDTMTKAMWAVLGLVPPLLFVSGAFMWWTRVVRPSWLRVARSQA